MSKSYFEILDELGLTLESELEPRPSAQSRLLLDPPPGWLAWHEQRETATRAPAYRKQPIPAKLRKQIFERDGYRCQECGDWHDLAVDHVMPESKGGPMTLDNLRTLCRSCNSRKGDRL